jgi:hypothetical protein
MANEIVAASTTTTLQLSLGVKVTDPNAFSSQQLHIQDALVFRRFVGV